MLLYAGRGLYSSSFVYCLDEPALRLTIAGEITNEKDINVE